MSRSLSTLSTWKKHPNKHQFLTFWPFQRTLRVMKKQTNSVLRKTVCRPTPGMRIVLWDKHGSKIFLGWRWAQHHRNHCHRHQSKTKSKTHLALLRLRPVKLPARVLAATATTNRTSFFILLVQNCDMFRKTKKFEYQMINYCKSIIFRGNFTSRFWTSDNFAVI